MDIEDKRKLGEELEPGDRPKAPGRLELLQRFVNTWNHELPVTWDRLGTPRRAQVWLRQKGLIARDAVVSIADAEQLRDFREALRATIGANGTDAHDPAALETLRAAGRAASLTVTIDDQGRTLLRARSPRADAATATLLSIVHEAQLSGDWLRLKACRHCQYSFFDRSRNRSAAWCSMSTCGNRNKNRAYYRRRHPRA
jgi:predicted RNA-binding Zn ribbon-like protein